MRNLEELFWPKVNKTDSCWLWTAFVHPLGYGKINFNGKTLTAHRVAYELCKGEIPKGLQLDHLCRVRHCVNPDHLEPVTHKVNCLRGISPHAINARKTHCIHGHEFTEDNIYKRKTGKNCKICQKRRARERNARFRLERATT